MIVDVRHLLFNSFLMPDEAKWLRKFLLNKQF